MITDVIISKLKLFFVLILKLSITTERNSRVSGEGTVGALGLGSARLVEPGFLRVQALTGTRNKPKLK